MKKRYYIYIYILILFFLFLKNGKVDEVLRIKKYDISQDAKILQTEYENKKKKLIKEVLDIKRNNDILLSMELLIHLRHECDKYKVNIYEVLAIIQVENSSFDENLININKNNTEDYGLMQINSCHLNEFFNMGFIDVLNPKENISYGVYHLSTLNNFTDSKKYMAYNMGVSGMNKAVSRGIVNTVYSKKVQERLHKITEGI